LAAKEVVMPPAAMMADAERPMRFKSQPNPLACAPVSTLSSRKTKPEFPAPVKVYASGGAAD
jgi:hypothetical protein